MPRYKIMTVETTTYAYYADFESEADAYENFEPEGRGKEIDYTYEVIAVEEVKD